MWYISQYEGTDALYLNILQVLLIDLFILLPLFPSLCFMGQQEELYTRLKQTGEELMLDSFEANNFTTKYSFLNKNYEEGPRRKQVVRL